MNQLHKHTNRPYGEQTVELQRIIHCQTAQSRVISQDDTSESLPQPVVNR